MLEDMQLRGLAPKTQSIYLQAVQQLAEHYGTSPDHRASRKRVSIAYEE
jgi:hypothetical protein